MKRIWLAKTLQHLPECAANDRGNRNHAHDSHQSTRERERRMHHFKSSSHPSRRNSFFRLTASWVRISGQDVIGSVRTGTERYGASSSGSGMRLYKHVFLRAHNNRGQVIRRSFTLTLDLFSESTVIITAVSRVLYWLILPWPSSERECVRAAQDRSQESHPYL